MQQKNKTSNEKRTKKKSPRVVVVPSQVYLELFRISQGRAGQPTEVLRSFRFSGFSLLSLPPHTAETVPSSGIRLGGAGGKKRVMMFTSRPLLRKHPIRRQHQRQRHRLRCCSRPCRPSSQALPSSRRGTGVSCGPLHYSVVSSGLFSFF